MAQSTISVSRLARDLVRARLAHATTGFNARLTSAMASASFTAPLSVKLPISFESASRNFVQADVGPDDLAGTTAISSPMMTLYAVSSQNMNRVKFHAFSGVVQLAMNVFISWPATRAMYDMETFADCIEEALYGTFNGDDVAGWPHGDARMVYNGELSVTRSQLVIGPENWSQRISARLTAEVHLRG